MSTHKRKYQLKARAERQHRTRDRIVAATVALHRDVGPARTTIADIARRAGVQRLTVYNLFPEARDLFVACQQRFLAGSPPPDLAPRVGNAVRGLQTTLTRLYGWYRETRAMEQHVHRDRHLVPALDELMRETIDARLARVAEAHAAAIGGRPVSPRLRAAVRLAFEFWTWSLLTRSGLDDAACAELMARMVRAARGGRASGARGGRASGHVR